MGEASGEQVESKPFRSEIVRGEPYQVGGRTLVPEARVVSFSRANATIGTNREGGWAGAFVHVAPTALVEQTPDGERRIPVVDSTTQALKGIAGAAVFFTIFFGIVRIVARLARRRGNGQCCG